jgi:glycosyltransferase involved in cell wall biosynthesis
LRFLCVSAVFSPAFDYGGIPHIVQGLAAGLISLGHPCQVIATSAGGARNLQVPVEEPTIYEGVPIIYTQRWRNNSFFYAPFLRRHLEALAPEYDIALVSGGWGYINLAARLALPQAGLPYVLNPQGLFDPWAFSHKYYKKLLYWHLVEKRNYAGAAGIVAMTDSEAGQVKEHVKGVPIQVIPNGVDLTQFQRPAGREELEKSFPGLTAAPYILFLSRLHPKKGLDLLFPAFQRLLEECREQARPQPYLVVAGDGDPEYKRAIEALAQSLGIAHQVLFPGLVTGDAKQALLQNCSFMVLPSRGEGLPMAVLEAMASGKPALITAGCYLPEVARAGAGLEVELNVEQLAQAMLQLWDNPRLRSDMGEKALALVKEKFTWVKVAEQTVQFCERLVAQGRRG